MQKLPSAVKRQGEEADRLLKEKLQGAEASKTEPANQGKPELHDVSKPKEQDSQQAAKKPDGDSPGDEQAAKPDSDEASEAEIWKKRFINLKATHDKIVPELRAEKQQLEEQLRNQASKFEEVFEKLSKLEAKKIEQPEKPDLQITDKERDEYGPEFVEMLSRITQGIQQNIMSEVRGVSSRVGDIEAQLKNLGGSVSNVVKDATQNKQHNFFEKLDGAVPNWETLQIDESWLPWLQKYDVLAGKARAVILEEAQNNLDADRAIALYKQFAEAHGLPVKAQQQGANTRSNAIESQITPDTTGGGSEGGGDANEPKYFTESEVARFYADVAMKRIPSDEIKRKELEILDAQQNNRIVKG